MTGARMRVAVVADFAEEEWPSMDLVAESLRDHLQVEHANVVDLRWIRPSLRRRFTRRGGPGGRGAAGKARFNADRLLNRFFDYPRMVASMRSEVDLFHIVDHTYAHLAAAVRPSPAIVTCHDLDAFRPIVEARKTGSALFRKMAERQLRGLRCAVMTACDTEATRSELLRYGLVEPHRAVTIPNGLAPVFGPAGDLDGDRHAAALLGPVALDTPEILHVGSTIPRKRIDLLLRVFAMIRAAAPAARLVRVGGPLTAAQAGLARDLAIERSIASLPFLEPRELAAIYRRARLLLVTSDAEGFGLPLLEALGCGTPALASDIPALREVGGDAAEFVAGADPSTWAARALLLLDERTTAPDRHQGRQAAGLAQAAKFSWNQYARRYVELYRRVLAA